VDDVTGLPGYAAFAAAARTAGVDILVSPMSKTAAVNVGPGALALGYVADGPLH
jgi:fatty acid-binding protein DegV